MKTIVKLLLIAGTLLSAYHGEGTSMLPLTACLAGDFVFIYDEDEFALAIAFFSIGHYGYAYIHIMNDGLISIAENYLIFLALHGMLLFQTLLYSHAYPSAKFILYGLLLLSNTLMVTYVTGGPSIGYWMFLISDALLVLRDFTSVADSVNVNGLIDYAVICTYFYAQYMLN